MKIISWKNDLADFAAWSGAVDVKNAICKAGKGEEFMTALEELYPDGIDETGLNDLLWFDTEYALSLVGMTLADLNEEEENDKEEEEAV